MSRTGILQLVPYPAKVIPAEGVCCLPAEFADGAGGRINDLTGIMTGIVTGAGICVTRKKLPEGEEAYLLQIRPEGITIEGMPQGVFYAVQTLRQLIRQFGTRIPCMEISDHPRFSYRGFMLDSSRHFLPVEDVKKLLDAAAAMKLNRFHWHLTDDQGWRIGIRKYPELAEKGARRGKAMFADIPEPEESAGYFTEEDVREIVSYAKERFIEVIPELEIPGHESALLHAYPDLRCLNTGEESRVQINGGIFKELLCAGNEKTYTFIEDVLDEYMELFPFPYIHLGGDEAVKAHWRTCPRCQAKMRMMGLPDENALQQWLVRYFADYLRSRGRHAVVWNEVLRGDALPADIAVQMWHGDADLGREFALRGGKIIQSDTQAYYLDYPYFITDLKKTLEFDPVPEYLCGMEDAVMGLEAPLWTERVRDIDRAAFQLFPRLPAAAESAWTQKESRDPESFPERYEALREVLNKMGLKGAQEKYWSISPEDAAAEKEEYERITKTPHMIRFVEEQENILKEEIRHYGRF